MEAQNPVITIAGSDSSGGAGIQADLKTFTALGHYGTSVITALTAQNTRGVQDIHPSPPEFVEKQISAVLDDIDVKAIKIGMLCDKANTSSVVNALNTHYGDRPIPPLVCDPVCVSTSGHTLLKPDAIEVMVKELFPLAALITPNRSEAEVLLNHLPNPQREGRKIETLESMVLAARDLLVFGSKAVLVKGGHITARVADVGQITALFPNIQLVSDFLIDESMEILQQHSGTLADAVVVDVLSVMDGAVFIFFRPRIDSTSTHGTGCTLSSAIACGLARGLSFEEAVRTATIYTYIGIETAPTIGKGNGPLNHLHSISQASIPRRTKLNPYPLTRLMIQSSVGTWKSYVEHDFVKLLGKGTLRRESFICFIKQDYHYLKYYARAYALLAAKSNTFPSIHTATQAILGVINEIETHRSFCAQFGITAEELETTEEYAPTTAYGAYLIDIGLQGDTAKLLMALLACLLGYGEVGLWLKKLSRQPGAWVVLDNSNPYTRWVDDYSGTHYQAAVKLGIETIEEIARNDPPSPARFKEWCEVWRRCTVFERGFWDMSMTTPMISDA